MPVTKTTLAKSREDAQAQAEAAGYPVVLKVVSPDISHKSDAGGVKLNLNSRDEVGAAHDAILASCKQHVPGAKITGVAVQHMAPQGTEVIVGMTKDPQFGPVMMFGLGGVMVEVLKDVSFRLVPLEEKDASQMIGEIEGKPILDGVRGQPPADVAALKRAILSVSKFVEQHPEVAELDLNPMFAYPDGAIAVDAASSSRRPEMAVPGHRLDKMFNPEAVAVIGDKGPGYMWIHNNLPFQEKGGRLYSVQLDPKEIEGIEKLGVKNYTSLADLPEPVDYAVVAVPRNVAPYVLKDLIAAGAHGAGFFTSGFAETGEELGVKLQAQLVEMARAANFNLVGPNCMGLYLPKTGVRFNADAPVADDGKIGFLSQSGTHGIMFSLVAAANGLHLSRCASFGNAVILDVSDYVEYLMADDETEVIGMYVEGVKDGQRFFATLREAAKRKPVVVWKGGQTEAGSRATMSHTGSLAAPQAIWDGMMRQCGAITTNNLDETMDVMKALLRTKRPTGTGMALLAQTGGQSVSISDAFAKAGFRVPRFSDSTYAELASFFNIIGGSYQNPLDMGGTIQGNIETLDKIFKIVDADPNIDAIAMELSAMFAARQWKRHPETLDQMIDALAAHAERSAKPFVVILHPAHEAEYVAQISPKFHEKDLPLFASFERAAAALARVSFAG